MPPASLGLPVINHEITKVSIARIIHRLPEELEATVVATVLNGGAVGATVRAGGCGGSWVGRGTLPRGSGWPRNPGRWCSCSRAAPHQSHQPIQYHDCWH